MSVSAVGATGSSSGTSVASRIAELRKQLQVLTKQLNDEVTSKDDAKTKEIKEQTLSLQISAVNLQISTLTNQQAKAAAESTSNSSPAKADQEKATQKAGDSATKKNGHRPADGAGWQVDVQL